MKDFKIKRYDYGRQQQRKQAARATVATIVLTVAALAAGWMIYPPVYDFVTNYDPQSLLQGEEPPAPAPAPPVSSSGSQPPQEEQKPEEEVFPQRAAYLPPETVADAARLEATLLSLREKGMDGVILDLKDRDGMVRYQSSLELVASNRAQSEEAWSLSQTAGAIRQAGLIPVGRIYAFRDHTSTAYMYESAVKYMDSPVNWIDDSKANGGKPWLNPNDQRAQDYIVALVEEAAENGVSAILLDGVQFPEGVSLELATYGNTGTLDRSAVLAGFLTRARGAAEARGGKLATTVNLLSAAGLSSVRYGEDVGQVIEAAGRAAVEVMPEQFGNGVTSEALTLSAPAQDPYNTVSEGLKASAEVLFGGEEGEEAAGRAELTAVVQAYTSTLLSEAANKTYGPQEVAEQVRAAEQAGIHSIWYLDPLGAYSSVG